MRFVYTAWFRDPRFPPDDQDYEWPACFVVEANDEQSAKRWGDHLAGRYALTHNQQFFASSVENCGTTKVPRLDDLPVVRDGHEASDDEIGW